MTSERAADTVKQSIQDAATQARREMYEKALRRKYHPWWTTIVNGRVYRPLMKVMHHFGWCYPQASCPDGDVMWWCHWCGLRGRK